MLLGNGLTPRHALCHQEPGSGAQGTTTGTIAVPVSIQQHVDVALDVGLDTTMMLADVIREAETLGDAAPEETLFRAAEIGERLEMALADPEALTGVARRIVALARELGCDHLLGASRLGERLASAAVVTAGNDLRLFDVGRPARHVLVVDGFAATGAQITAACRRAESRGATHVSAAAVLILPRGKDNLSASVGVISPLTPRN